MLECSEAVTVNTINSVGSDLIIPEPLREKRHNRYPVLRRKLVTDIEVKKISLKQNLLSGNVNDEVVVRMRVATDIYQFDSACAVTQCPLPLKRFNFDRTRIARQAIWFQTVTGGTQSPSDF